jgi:hypothetical protein
MGISTPQVVKHIPLHCQLSHDCCMTAPMQVLHQELLPADELNCSMACDASQSAMLASKQKYDHALTLLLMCGCCLPVLLFETTPHKQLV